MLLIIICYRRRLCSFLSWSLSRFRGRFRVLPSTPQVRTAFGALPLFMLDLLFRCRIPPLIRRLRRQFKGLAATSFNVSSRARHWFFLTYASFDSSAPPVVCKSRISLSCPCFDHVIIFLEPAFPPPLGRNISFSIPLAIPPLKFDSSLDFFFECFLRRGPFLESLHRGLPPSSQRRNRIRGFLVFEFPAILFYCLLLLLNSLRVHSLSDFL